MKGLLFLRNTPLKCGKSPAELMMGRILRDNLPRLQPTTSPKQRPVSQERIDAKRFHDRKIQTRATPNGFSRNQRVAIQDEFTREWTRKGSIIDIVAPRSYTIKMDNGNILRRNQRHIRKVHAIVIHQTQRMEEGQEDAQPMETDTDTDAESDTTVIAENNDTDSDSTIPYEMESDLDSDITTPYRDPEPGRTKSGRVIKKKFPIDYNDL